MFMIERNLGRRRAAEVKVEEVLPHARKNCRVCSGTGVLRPLGRSEQVCGCAAVRFYREHPELIVQADGRAWWPAPEEEQPRPAAPPVFPPDMDPTADEGGDTSPLTPGDTARLERLEREYLVALQEVNEVQALMDAAAGDVKAELETQEALVTQLRQERNTTDGEIGDAEGEVESLRRELAEAEAELSSLKEHWSAVEECHLAALAGTYEIEERLKEAGRHLRPRQRKALERKDQLRKRIDRLRATGG